MDFYGFERIDFEFEGHPALLVLPKEPDAKRNVALKTEYFGAFPNTEIELLKKGFHLAYIKNNNRWATPEDCATKARFIKHIAKEYGLREQVVTVGMSCGGAFSVNLAGWHPDTVLCMYLEAPVLSFFSCPAELGTGRLGGAWENEFVKAYPGITKAGLFRSDAHPMCRIPTLIEQRIPFVMTYGPQDLTVPYEENGALLAAEYAKTDIPHLVITRYGMGHHPHGLADPTPVIDFILKMAE